MPALMGLFFFFFSSVLLATEAFPVLQCETCNGIGISCNGKKETCRADQHLCFVFLQNATIGGNIVHFISKGCTADCKFPKDTIPQAISVDSKINCNNKAAPSSGSFFLATFGFLLIKVLM